jgi:hypothetical protein
VDDGLPLASLVRVEGGDGIIESHDVAYIRPQSYVSYPLDDLTQLSTIWLDNEVDRPAIVGPRLGRPDDGHQYSSSASQAGGPLLNVAADDIEDQIYFSHVFGPGKRETTELLSRLRIETQSLPSLARTRSMPIM